MTFLENDQVLTTDEAIAYLKISKPTFLKYVHLGKIRAVRAGKGWRVLASELVRFVRGEDLRKDDVPSTGATCIGARGPITPQF